MHVTLVDDAPLFRTGLAALLTAAGIEVVGQARCGDEALARLDEDRPDVVVLDIHMPPTFTDEGLSVAREVKRRHPTIGVLLLSAYVEVTAAARVFDDCSEGIGYLLKDRVEHVEELIAGMHRLRAGALVLDPDVVEALFQRRRNARALSRLSGREREVLRAMAEGRSNAGIAAQMHVSVKTVEAHVASVFAKLDLPASQGDNRRVRAVLAWLRAQG